MKLEKMQKNKCQCEWMLYDKDEEAEKYKFNFIRMLEIKSNSRSYNINYLSVFHSTTYNADSNKIVFNIYQKNKNFILWMANAIKYEIIKNSYLNSNMSKLSDDFICTTCSLKLFTEAEIIKLCELNFYSKDRVKNIFSYIQQVNNERKTNVTMP